MVVFEEGHLLLRQEWVGRPARIGSAYEVQVVDYVVVCRGGTRRWHRLQLLSHALKQCTSCFFLRNVSLL